jgi:hypothetical protein
MHTNKFDIHVNPKKIKCHSIVLVKNRRIGILDLNLKKNEVQTISPNRSTQYCILKFYTIENFIIFLEFSYYFFLDRP